MILKRASEAVIMTSKEFDLWVLAGGVSWQSKREQRRPRRNGHILLAVNRKRHRRRKNRSAALEVPQHFARSRLERDEVSLRVTREHQPARRGKHAGPGRRSMFPFPLELACGGIECAQRPPKRLRIIIRKISGTIVGVPCFIRLLCRRKDVALLACGTIKKFRLRIVRRRHPIRRSKGSRANAVSVRCRCAGFVRHGPARRVL